MSTFCAFPFCSPGGRVSLSVKQDETVLARGAAAMATRSACPWLFCSCVFSLHGCRVSGKDKARSSRRNEAGNVGWIDLFLPSVEDSLSAALRTVDSGIAQKSKPTQEPMSCPQQSEAKRGGSTASTFYYSNAHHKTSPLSESHSCNRSGTQICRTQTKDEVSKLRT